jgi:hypothetical protein
MKAWPNFFRVALICAGAALCAVGWVPGARAQPAVDPDAQSVLAGMANYLGDLQSFSVEYSTVDEIITPAGEKLQFLHSGEIIVQRPNKLYATRVGAAGTSEIFLDEKGLSLYGTNVNAYLQLGASSIDAAVDSVRNLGFDAPGADLLASKPLDNPTTDITSGTYVGDTFIDGVKVHQLAFRGTNVDWQLWVTAGDKPLPLRYVITTKWLSGAPQYTLELRNWNAAPNIDAARFTFVPPQGAKRLDPSSVTVNAIGDMTINGK